jgi:glucose-1-phosphate thymidylyltransferase
MKAIILAAGFATRLYPLTLNKAKPLLEIKGKPIIDYIIRKIKEIPADEIIIVTNNVFYKDFLEWKSRTQLDNVEIINDNVSDLNSKLGAIGDLLFAIDKKAINDDLFVISGDNIFNYSLKEPYEIFEKEKKDLSVFYDVNDINEAKRFGIALIQNNLIADFEEKPQNPKSTLCSTSTYFFKRETIPLMKRFVKEEKNSDQPGLFLRYLYKNTPIWGYVPKEKWIDIGTFEAFQRAQLESWN